MHRASNYTVTARYVPVRCTQAEAIELFEVYDVDASGSLEMPEVRMLLQDLCERRRGHRNVTEEQVLHAMEQMDEKMKKSQEEADQLQTMVLLLLEKNKDLSKRIELFES